ncbi:hypothetical protein SAMN05421678_108239 [Actinopolymorpha cephalotaxi]|uniref:Uncharacterized protein n=1 Tax=Actinopolymorpha cephalotaxi TaxID=504797 RepID=A0A1I2UM65_9ACTN|nr:hypothetical protein [Actinopolymorpha cephalotaxi]SFG78225.1 hypothetical protein SAMN05421678_108239 [Actinopolymorpha cephalotaxi]
MSHDARCVDGWLGEDGDGHPIACLVCRPHLRPRSTTPIGPQVLTGFPEPREPVDDRAERKRRRTYGLRQRHARRLRMIQQRKATEE